ncbi:Putative 115 kDa protein in type-1 retrotransposable element R1DM [Eumeta japonica]|uniref:115 kDa protein in type-1 retrotransposable element R1DM n=1 Tax=Eumeta variegata TaxID=151549 RepID=A0A4C1U8G1_EUMVA|nr:Putative 115 kDa protein in type-1 retrotransposable element R1DM [Eumeta japonica]
MVALYCKAFITESAEEKTEDLMKRVTQACDAKLISEYKKARQELNKAIKDSKRRCWKELVEGVEKDPWGRPYKVVMAHLKSQPMPSPMSPKLLHKIVTALFPQQRKFDYPTAQDESEDIPTVSEKELMDACNRIGNNKAPGLDGIPNIALKTAIKAAPALFTETYDTCLKEGYFPSRWKQQRLVLLLKGKKPPEEPSSYRPRCMLDMADIKNVFNSANWDWIMRALEEKNIPKYLCRVVASYFTNRVLKYDMDKGLKEYKITGGVPQGSVLGPLLWNIMYEGLLKVTLPKEVKLMAYADDVAVIIVAKHFDEINLAFDKAFERINQWMKTVNLQLAKHKTEAVLITRRKKAETIKLQV